MSVIETLAVKPHQELEYVVSCDLPTKWANFRMHAFKEVASCYFGARSKLKDREFLRKIT